MQLHIFTSVSGKRFLMALILIVGMSCVNGVPAKAAKTVRGAATKDQAFKKYFKTLNNRDGKGFVYITCTSGLEQSLDLLTADQTSDTYVGYIQNFMDKSPYSYKEIKKGKYKKISSKQKGKYEKTLRRLPKASENKPDLKGAYSVKIKYKGKASSESKWGKYESVLILYKSAGRWFVLDVD